MFPVEPFSFSLDIWSLGGVVYRVLFGDEPFAGLQCTSKSFFSAVSDPIPTLANCLHALLKGQNLYLHQCFEPNADLVEKKGKLDRIETDETGEDKGSEHST